MLGVCFFIEPLSNCGRQIRTEEWRTLAESFGIDTLIAVNTTNFECWQFEDGPSFPDIKRVVEAYPNAKRVFVDKDGPVEPTYLYSYQHPEEDVIYFFGANCGGFRNQYKGIDGDWVQIHQTGRAGIWAIQAASIVMQDRWHRGNH